MMINDQTALLSAIDAGETVWFVDARPHNPRGGQGWVVAETAEDAIRCFKGVPVNAPARRLCGDFSSGAGHSVRHAMRESADSTTIKLMRTGRI